MAELGGVTGSQPGVRAMTKRLFTRVLAACALVATFGAAALGGGAAGAVSPSVVYVSPSGSPDGAGTSCATAQYTSIQDAVDAAPAGGTVRVCAGTYHESVTIDHRLILFGLPGAVIDASGQPYGVGVAASYSTVMNLEVANAGPGAVPMVDDGMEGPFDGIVTAGFTGGGPKAALNGVEAADHVTIIGNLVHDNAGAGIDIETSSYDVVANNDSHNNGIGINVSNDFGSPASHNVIQNNNASDNPGGCGIVLADHSGAGVFGNVVTGNRANRNGLGSPSAPDASSGSGVILAGGSGGVYGNAISGNTFDGNGHAGVALHGHAPGMNFSGNSITGNSIGTNNLRQDAHDPFTTGIYLGSASPLSIVVSGNLIHDDHYGVFTAGSINVIGSNVFTNVTVPKGSTPVY